MTQLSSLKTLILDKIAHSWAGTAFANVDANTNSGKMKTTKNILTLALVVMASVAFAGPAPSDSIQVIDTKDNTLFVIKADKTLKGAEVEVYHSNGDLLDTQTLSKRKMVIDFRDVKFGSYVIKVTKDGNTREFNYDKVLILSDIIR